VTPSTLDMITDAITRYESFSGDVEDVRAYEHRPRLTPKSRNGNGGK
jgi:hypothetical protein